jgi:hypothetical protein
MNRRFQSAQTDFIAAAFIAQNMSPPAKADGFPVWFPAATTRTGAAQNQDARHGFGRLTGFSRHQRRFQIVRRVARRLRPNFCGGGANPLPVRTGPHPRHANGDSGQGRDGPALEAFDRHEMFHQRPVIQKAEIGRTEFRAKTGQVPSRRQKRNAAGRSAFHAKI